MILFRSRRFLLNGVLNLGNNVTDNIAIIACYQQHLIFSKKVNMKPVYRVWAQTIEVRLKTRSGYWRMNDQVGLDRQSLIWKIWLINKNRIVGCYEVEIVNLRESREVTAPVI